MSKAWNSLANLDKFNFKIYNHTFINIYIYIYIYKTETFETPTIFHVSIIFFKKNINKKKKKLFKQNKTFLKPDKCKTSSLPSPSSKNSSLPSPSSIKTHYTRRTHKPTEVSFLKPYFSHSPFPFLFHPQPPQLSTQ